MRAASPEIKMGELIQTGERRIAYSTVNLNPQCRGPANACDAIAIDASRFNASHKGYYTDSSNDLVPIDACVLLAGVRRRHSRVTTLVDR
jgi:hypothetical protein